MSSLLDGTGTNRQPKRQSADPRRVHSHTLAILVVRCGLLAIGVGIAVCITTGTLGAVPADQEGAGGRICKPRVGEVVTVELGQAGIFGWICAGGRVEGSGFYVVFVRPSGTYVLLKVPHGRTSFEFTPDTQGLWRWIVINTDPDGTKPDVESEPGHFEVLPARPY